MSSQLNMEVLQEVDGLCYCSIDSLNEDEFKRMSNLISEHLLEPYSIYVYWYFLNTELQYCFAVKESRNSKDIIGIIVSKIDIHRDVRIRGYIGMLVVDPKYRGRKIATRLIELTIRKMIEWDNVDEITLETEVKNAAALKLYESFGFCRVKRLYKYYMNTDDAYRLILPITEKSGMRSTFLPSLSNTKDKQTTVN